MTDESPVDVDAKLRRLEEQLENAVARQDFVEAAQCRDELQGMRSSSLASLLGVKANFYRAYSQGSVTEMREVWLESDEVSASHAMEPLAMGYNDVIGAWISWFAKNGMPIEVKPDIDQVVVQGSTAFVCCTEWIHFEEGLDGVPFQATSIFLQKKDRWFMTHYHASPLLHGVKSKAGSNQ